MIQKINDTEDVKIEKKVKNGDSVFPRKRKIPAAAKPKDDKRR